MIRLFCAVLPEQVCVCDVARSTTAYGQNELICRLVVVVGRASAISFRQERDIEFLALELAVSVEVTTVERALVERLRTGASPTKA